MTNYVWQKADSVVDARIMRFLAGSDVLLDRELFEFDVRASAAHVEGLARIGLLSAAECHALVTELDALGADFRAGRFVLDARYEDGQSAIEARLSERLGEIGRKVHSGRSRNDQVLVASRLWLKDALRKLHGLTVAIAAALLERARNNPALAMPGYTHLQRAVVSSSAMWLAGFAEAFVDDAALVVDTHAWIDANPLGTAAGYGVNLKLDRQFTTERLGFARLQISPIYAQLSRGKFELQALAALSQVLLTVRRLAWDLSLFSSAEFGFVALPPEYTTGSSIMPNKRNPDVVELLRACAAVALGARAEIEALLSLPSGYQRDLQFSKGPLLRAFAHGLQALELLPDLLTRFAWREAPMRAAIDPAMYATDHALELAADGIPFRDAYLRVLEDTEELAARLPEESLAARTSPGGAADMRLEDVAARLSSVSAAFAAPELGGK